MFRKLNFFLILLIPGQIVLAQGIRDSVFTIEMVEIRAERIFQKEEAGMKKTSVDSLVIAEKINLSLSELLSENTTIYIKEYGRGALATASFRGTSPTHTQVSWNGININSPMLGMVDFSLIPVYIVDEINLQHGGASVSESSGGLGGHISIQNNVDWKNRFSGRYYQGISSFSTFDEFGQFNLGNEIIQSKTRMYHNYSRNDYSILNTHISDKRHLHFSQQDK
jgi:iron complex outermembrane receptor protein